MLCDYKLKIINIILIISLLFFCSDVFGQDLKDIIKSQNQKKEILDQFKIQYKSELQKSDSMIEEMKKDYDKIQNSKYECIVNFAVSQDRMFVEKIDKSGHEIPKSIRRENTNYLIGSNNKDLVSSKNDSITPYGVPFYVGVKSEIGWISDILSNMSNITTVQSKDKKWGGIVEISGDFSKKVENKLRKYHVIFKFSVDNRYLCVDSKIASYDRKKGMVNHEKIISTVDFKGEKLAKDIESIVGETDRDYGIRIVNTLIDYNDIVPDSLFDVNLNPGTKIYDQDKDEFYKLGPNGIKIKDESYEKFKNRSKNLIIGWVFVLSILALSLLGVGWFVRWYQKRNQ